MHIYIYIQIQNFVVDNTEISNQSHNEGMVVVLIVSTGAEQSKEWVILRIQERVQQRCAWIES